jgi:REP element-mobilizing transposase RayT
MPQSLSKILVHVTFSTKGRMPVLAPAIHDELFRYLAGTLKNIGCPPTIIGGYLDHVHILCTLSKTLSVSKMIETVKSSSSRWLKTKQEMPGDFAWQAGYGAFSVRHPGLRGASRRFTLGCDIFPLQGKGWFRSGPKLW